jgi:hypothetical protein
MPSRKYLIHLKKDTNDYTYVDKLILIEIFTRCLVFTCRFTKETNFKVIPWETENLIMDDKL